jgi:hypothetical protein
MNHYVDQHPPKLKTVNGVEFCSFYLKPWMTNQNSQKEYAKVTEKQMHFNQETKEWTYWYNVFIRQAFADGTCKPLEHHKFDTQDEAFEWASKRINI